MQRLFSTFADGWPGAGLLIQRLIVGAILIHFEFACRNSAVMRSIAALAGILLIVGLWTPIAGLLVAGVEAWVVLSARSNAVIPLLLAALGLTLAMIGPGAWSVDARLFGRKHIAFRGR